MLRPMDTAMPLTRNVSVQVITLNEGHNIRGALAAILANSPGEVVVIDGGSTDATVAIAREMGARVLEPGRLGRGSSRRIGYFETDLPYIAFVDADDRINPDWLTTTLQEFFSGHYAALQSSLRVLDPRGFWEKGWNEYFRETVKPAADTRMIGHPALYLASALQGGPTQVGHEHEDTQMSVDFVNRGLRQGIGSAIAMRHVPSSRSENLDKWKDYGRGYRVLVDRLPDRKKSILKHIWWTIPVSRGWRPVLRGKFLQPLWAFYMGTRILYGFYFRKS
jgi:glycosyltransferase involved in cell wall biosynthesis